MPITGLLRSIMATTGRRRTMAAGAGATGTAIGCAEIRRGLPTRSAVKFLGIANHRIGSIYSPAPSQGSALLVIAHFYRVVQAKISPSTLSGCARMASRSVHNLIVMQLPAETTPKRLTVQAMPVQPKKRPKRSTMYLLGA